MQHKTLDQIRAMADVFPQRSRTMSTQERLECWAEALEREGDRRLSTLFEIEYAPPQKRAAIRADDSPLTVAFNDPRLREAGLEGDTVGQAIAFFGISEKELHSILCFCFHGETMSAHTAAARVRAAAVQMEDRQARRPSPIFVGGGFIGALIGLAALTV